MPILREIVLYDEDYENRTGNALQDWENKIKFTDETRYIISLYERFLPKIRTESCGKLNIHCTAKKEEKVYQITYNICEMHIHFDYDKYIHSDIKAKQEIVLQTVERAMEFISKEWGLDLELFKEAAEKVRERNFINEWIHQKKMNNSRTYKAEIHCAFEYNQFVMTLNVMDKKREVICSKHVVTTKPSEFAFFIYLGELEWETNNKVNFYDNRLLQKNKLISVDL